MKVNETLDDQLPLKLVIIAIIDTEAETIAKHLNVATLLLKNGARLSDVSEIERKTLLECADKADNHELNSLIKQEQSQSKQSLPDAQTSQVSATEKQGHESLSVDSIAHKISQTDKDLGIHHPATDSELADMSQDKTYLLAETMDMPGKFLVQSSIVVGSLRQADKNDHI